MPRPIAGFNPRSRICRCCKNNLPLHDGTFEPAPRKTNQNECWKHTCRKCVAKSQWKRRDKDKNRKYYRTRHQNFRKLILNAYGNRCECCGETEPEFLALDHRFGGGAEHRRCRPGTSVLRDVIREGFPPKYRILCHNCNMATRLGTQCPHERKKKCLSTEVQKIG